MIYLIILLSCLSYDEALQALADSEAKREIAEKELKIVRERWL